MVQEAKLTFTQQRITNQISSLPSKDKITNRTQLLRHTPNIVIHTYDINHI